MKITRRQLRQIIKEAMSFDDDYPSMSGLGPADDHLESITSQDMADLMLSLGATDAIGLDGGGSTSMTIENCWHNHVVNHPSDNFQQGHDSFRAVSDGVFVWD